MNVMYKIAFKLSNYVWDIIYIQWDLFTKKTIGVQMVNAVDSISANIAEGFGRHFKKDKVNFYRYSKGSLKESFDWNEKAKGLSRPRPRRDYETSTLGGLGDGLCLMPVQRDRPTASSKDLRRVRME